MDTAPSTLGVAEAAVVKALYCRPLRLHLALWILSRDGEPFFLLEAQQAMATLGEAGSGTRTELIKFRDLGLLQEVPDGRRSYFHVIASPHWKAYEAIGMAMASVRR